MSTHARYLIVTAISLIGLGQAAHGQSKVTLTGAGASFPGPIYAKWFESFKAANPAVSIQYETIGSEAGVRKLLTGDIDFGATDDPGILNEIKAQEEGKYLLLPSVVGAVVPIVNLPGFANEVSFTSEALAGIFSGKIKKWNDPVLRQANPGLRLPDLDIVVVTRKDGSGTTFLWTDFLSKTNPEWNSSVGTSMMPKWPAGRPANGSRAVSELVKELGGSIGYVEYIFALQNHLSSGRVRNRSGKFVRADLESIEEAVRSAMVADDFKVSIVNPPGAGAYPVASFTWFVVPKRIEDGTKREAMVRFLKWMLGPGQRQAAALGYVALPEGLARRVEAAVLTIQ